jgi:hypothetical protein
MAYFIFLKYLDNLEEYRKNSHVQIPSKSPCANFQICQKSEIQIKFERVLLLELGSAPVFGPTTAHFLFPSATSRSPSPHWASNTRPAQLTLSAQPTTRRWCPARLPPPSWGNASPHAAFAPLRARLIGGPHLSSPSSSPAQARPCRHCIPPPLATTQHLEIPPPCHYSHHHQSPALNPPLSRPTFNGVKAITVGRFPLPRPGVPLPGHYKRARSTPGHHHTHPHPPLLAPESATPTSPSTDCRRRFPPSPGHLTTARPPVRPLTSSSTPTPRPPPLPRRP